MQILGCPYGLTAVGLVKKTKNNNNNKNKNKKKERNKQTNSFPPAFVMFMGLYSICMVCKQLMRIKIIFNLCFVDKEWQLFKCSDP